MAKILRLHIGRCDNCDKNIYLSKKDAKRIMRQTLGSKQDGAREFQCPTNIDWWHWGHLPQRVRQGKVTIREIREANEKKQT
jgi:hypothetical protein